MWCETTFEASCGANSKVQRRKRICRKINIMLRVETEFKFHKMEVVSEFYVDVNSRLRTTKISLKLKQYTLHIYEMLTDIGSLQ
jgi:hypothetical protein